MKEADSVNRMSFGVDFSKLSDFTFSNLERISSQYGSKLMISDTSSFASITMDETIPISRLRELMIFVDSIYDDPDDGARKTIDWVQSAGEDESDFLPTVSVSFLVNGTKLFYDESVGDFITAGAGDFNELYRTFHPDGYYCYTWDENPVYEEDDSDFPAGNDLLLELMSDISDFGVSVRIDPPADTTNLIHCSIINAKVFYDLQSISSGQDSKEVVYGFVKSLQGRSPFLDDSSKIVVSIKVEKKFRNQLLIAPNGEDIIFGNNLGEEILVDSDGRFEFELYPSNSFSNSDGSIPKVLYDVKVSNFSGEEVNFKIDVSSNVLNQNIVDLVV